MVDSMRFKVIVSDEKSDLDYEQFRFPFLIGQRVNENGEVTHRYLDHEPIISPITGAKCQVRAISAGVEGQPLHRVGGYELDINVPACIIGRNHLLVNGVFRAAEAGLEVIRFYVAGRGCTAFGLDRLRLDHVALTSVTPTYLFEFSSLEQAQKNLRELRDFAEAIFNYEQPHQRVKKKSGRKRCFSVGPDGCFTLYIKLRGCTIVAYIKEPNVPDAFASYPSPEVEKELEEKAARTIRIEIVAHEKWLQDNDLVKPDAWRGNPSAYRKVFELARNALRLDESLRVRAPSEAIIAKLPGDHQTVLRAHLNGSNIREHDLVCAGATSQVINAQHKKFSAFKCLILEATGVDLSIPWATQSTMLSPHLKDWFKFPGEFVPPDSLKEYIFSRVSAPKAIEILKAKTAKLMDKTEAPRRGSGIGSAPILPEELAEFNRSLAIGSSPLLPDSSD